MAKKANLKVRKAQKNRPKRSALAGGLFHLVMKGRYYFMMRCETSMFLGLSASSSFSCVMSPFSSTMS